VSNNFPDKPDDFELYQITYQAILPHPGLTPYSPLNFTGVTGVLSYSVPVIGLIFAFDTPGSYGSYDQAEVEGGLAGAVVAICDVLEAMAGVPSFTLQQQVQVIRTWTWQSGTSGLQFSVTDQMPFPVTTDADACTGTDAGEQSAESDTDACTGTDAGEGIAILGFTDTDSSSSTDAGENVSTL
jgi:hypothetical protein